MRRDLESMGHQVDEAPEDDEVRETYNFAPGSIGVVFRAAIDDSNEKQNDKDDAGKGGDSQGEKTVKVKHKLQAMKWGLIPFWTKTQPTYGSLMKTINARDDSLQQEKGMWTSMKKRKRCIVVCTGYYEWRKDDSNSTSKTKRIPYYFKRTDGRMMCIAGLWDSVRFEGSDHNLYTYTVITTAARDDLASVHDRMPVILEPGEDINTWLDPSRETWTSELHSLLKPFRGELEWYEVTTDVNKVGNNSEDFIVPVENVKKRKKQQGIQNFFSGNTKKTKTGEKRKTDVAEAVNQDNPSKTRKLENPQTAEEKEETAQLSEDWSREEDWKSID
ncbi:hypothetical protein KEM56_003216 [Ascosphaera pollenicola]|nr:hypothetical protein KEM56_003216 [Ascosphaera pollenicola]